MITSDFKKGDLVRIIKRPKQWSSGPGFFMDVRDRVTYPFEAIIEDMINRGNHIAISIKNGGWSLDSLIEGGCIELAQPRETEPLFIN